MSLGSLPFALITLLAVAPARRPRPMAVVSWLVAMAPSELPLTFLAIVALSTAPDAADGVAGAGEWASLAVTGLTVVGLAVLAGRAVRARAAVRQALAGSLGRPDLPRLREWPWWRILLVPWPFRPHDVTVERDVSYGPDPHQRLDVYRARGSRPAGPTLVHLHGGRFRRGRKSREGRPLLHRLAREGWTCISADYHLSRTPALGFPRHLVDVKRVLAWIRTHGPDHGADPGTIVLTGSSAGAHLTAMAAVTPNEPRFQPGFEAVDTSFTAGVGLYGYYGPLGADDHPPTEPGAYDGAEAPPLLVVHGTNDTCTPIAGARRFVDRMRATSPRPVVLVDLPGAQHSFDLFHSIRFTAVVDGIASFAAWARSEASPRRGADRRG